LTALKKPIFVGASFLKTPERNLTTDGDKMQLSAGIKRKQVMDDLTDDISGSLGSPDLARLWFPNSFGRGWGSSPLEREAAARKNRSKQIYDIESHSQSTI